MSSLLKETVKKAEKNTSIRKCIQTFHPDSNPVKMDGTLTHWFGPLCVDFSTHLHVSLLDDLVLPPQSKHLSAFWIRNIFMSYFIGFSNVLLNPVNYSFETLQMITVHIEKTNFQMFCVGNQWHMLLLFIHIKCLTWKLLAMS